MQNKTLIFTVKVVATCLFLCSCSALKKRASINLDKKPTAVEVIKPIHIQLSAKPGYTERHVYHVSSVTKKYDQ
ncbi:MAG: hypothetical protein KDD37_10260, partial [Bdellovibrionales bacterium]|nr:hypothetical protein [Bdellovibrionales bacterium]